MKTLITFGLGALAMYLLDREQGPRRRALLREQWTRLAQRGPGAQRGPEATPLEADKPVDTPPGAYHLGR
jgi:hypothetical protein